MPELYCIFGHAEEDGGAVSYRSIAPPPGGETAETLAVSETRHRKTVTFTVIWAFFFP
jgi:hypothetical protein